MAAPASLKLIGAALHGWAACLLLALVTTSVWAQAEPPAYVANESCLDCHAEQARVWRGSHHAQAMAPATAASVRGDFGGSQFTHAGVTSRFFKKGEAFFVHTDGPEGKLADFEVKYSFGVEPLQQYLIAMPGGRLQALQIAWNTQTNAWFHLLPQEKAPPGDVLHWTGRYQTANTLCIVCHTTGYERRYDALRDSFDSRWQEDNVACQACHGPGSQHLQWARASAAEQAAWPAQQPKGLAVELHGNKRQKLQDICAPCHARRSELSVTGVPGQALLDHYLPSVLRSDLYYADGQQREEVYVDGSFRQSRMFRFGVTCTNCHDAHSGKLRLAGNATCLQCHTQPAKPQFPSAAGNFDTPAHHFHKADSPGAQCVACHMPARQYMRAQARPDHSLRIPRPDLSAKTGAPNACNGCHSDKTSQWAAAAVATWYGPRRHQEAHFGQALADYRAGKPGAANAVLSIVADPQANPIVRATALDALREDGQTGLATRIQALSDPADEVRTAAADSLARVEPRRRMAALVPLLSDPIRAVRLAAVHSLSDIPRRQFEAAQLPAFDQAVAEYVAVQSLALDMPGAQFNLALMYQNTGQAKLAETHYLAALRLDPDFSPARMNLAQLLAGQGRLADAQRTLQAGLARHADIGEMQYALGLLLAQQDQLPRASEALRKAAKLLPGRARVQYNLGLLYQALDQPGNAEQALLAAARIDATDADVLYALAAYYLHARQYGKVRQWTQRLQQASANDRRVIDLQRTLVGH